MDNPLQIGLSHWLTWFKRSVNRRILGAIITVGGLAFLVKMAGLCKELIIAQQFGTSDALDAFLIAFLMPSFAINVVAGSFNASIIPTFIQVRENNGKRAAQSLFSSVMVWSILLLLGLSFLLAIVAPYIFPILGSGFGSEKIGLTQTLFYLLLPILFFSGLATIWASILNAGERFALAAIAPIITPGITVVALMVFGRGVGIYALVIGTVMGYVSEAGLLLAGLRKQGFSLIPRWYGLDVPMKKVIGQYLPMTAGAILMGSTSFVDQSMAAMLGPGSVSVLSYGNKLIGFILGVGSLALSTAVFPHFSRMVAVKDWIGVRYTLKTYIRLVLVITIPLVLLFMYFSEPIVKILFERGAFSATDTRFVANVQVLYLMQVPFYMTGMLGVRLLSALIKNQILMGISAVNLVTNIVGNCVFVRYMGVAGISLSTSIVYAISMFLIFLSLFKQLRKEETHECEDF